MLELPVELPVEMDALGTVGTPEPLGSLSTLHLTMNGRRGTRSFAKRSTIGTIYLSAFLDNKKTPVFTNGITIRHACDIVGDGLMLVLLRSGLEFRGQQPDIRTECAKELADDVLCLCTHARHLVVPVKMLPQELFELLLLLGDFPAESDQRWKGSDFVQGPRACLLDIHCAL